MRRSARPTADQARPEMISPKAWIDARHPIRPTWRGRLHAIAFCVALPAVITLVGVAGSAGVRIAVIIYGISLLGLFGASAAYHHSPDATRRRLWFRRLDHSMIFVLIAGTYTPVIALVLPATWSIPILAVVWGVAATGVALKLTMVDLDRSVGSWLYVVMGWAGIIVLPRLLGELDVLRLSLLFAGGILYTVGAIILASRRPDPAPRVFGYHEVWHGFTIGAGACHFALIALLV